MTGRFAGANELVVDIVVLPVFVTCVLRPPYNSGMWSRTWRVAVNAGIGMVECGPVAGGVRWPKANWEIPVEPRRDGALSGEHKVAR
jgi:hypothetical protein